MPGRAEAHRSLHERCHRARHKANGAVARWGRERGRDRALDMHWLFTLKHVSTSPAAAAARAVVRIYTGHGYGSGV